MYYFRTLLTIVIILGMNLVFAESQTPINTTNTILDSTFSVVTDKQSNTQIKSDYTPQILTGIFSICSMLLGLGISQVIQLLKQHKTNKTMYDLWLTSLQLLQKSLHAQVNFLVGYQASFDSHDYRISPPKIYLELENKFIVNYRWEDLLSFCKMHYRRNINNDQLPSKVANLSFVMNSTIITNNRLTNDFKEHMDGVNSIMDRVAQLMNSLNKECLFILEQLAADKDKKEDYIHSQKLFALYDKEFYHKYSDPDSNLVTLSEEFIKPFIQYLVINHLHLRFSKLLEILMELNHNLRQIVVNNHKFEDSIESFISSFEDNYLQLTRILDRT